MWSMASLIGSCAHCCVYFAGYVAVEKKRALRGVKEVVKVLRKRGVAVKEGKLGDKGDGGSAKRSGGKKRQRGSGGGADSASCVCILAADIVPADVISHLPVLCEWGKVPFIFVPSKLHLGAAMKTKRPTSCVLVVKDDAFGSAYDAVHKQVRALFERMLLGGAIAGEAPDDASGRS